MPAGPFHASLWGYGQEDAERTWESMRRCWKEWHGVDFSTFASNERLLALGDARNAIVHGLGRLTRKQRRADGGRKVIARLGKVGVQVTGDELSLEPATVAVSRSVVIELIEWLDGEVRVRGLTR